MLDQVRPADTVVQLAPHQVQALKSETRFDVRVWARRSGKTYYTIVRQLMRIEEQGQGDWQSFYFAPTRTQAKQIAWPYLSRFKEPLGAELNIAELKFTIPGKGFLQLMNGEQFDRARGLYMDDVTLDEAADIPRAAYTEVISPAISDRQGRMTVMGTPRGRLNLLYDLWELAGGDDPDWSRSLLNWEQAGMVKPEEVERNRRQQSEAQFKQEWECSWDGATPGAYWADVMGRADLEGRVTSVKEDKGLRTVAALDLGHHDLMPVIWAQMAGTQCRVVRCKTYQFTSIPDLVRDWRNEGFRVDRLIVPHDAKVTDLSSGKTRLQTFYDLGLSDVVVAPKLHLDEGIELTRQFLEHCIFDREETRHLREGLSQYRSEFDEIRGVHRVTPIHDAASHYADAMRYLATGDKELEGWGGPRRQFRGAV